VTTIAITRDDRGELVGLGEKDQRAYERLKKKMSELERGEIMTIETWFDRNGKLQGLHHTMMRAIWDSQEQYEDYDEFRAACYCAIGHCWSVPGLDGKPFRVAKSTDYKHLDDPDFAKVHDKVWNWFYTEQATRMIWPLTPSLQAMNQMNELLDRFSDENRKLYNERKKAQLGEL